jgi:hypothetical protein
VQPWGEHTEDAGPKQDAAENFANECRLTDANEERTARRGNSEHERELNERQGSGFEHGAGECVP